MEHVFIYMWTKWLVVILPRMREGLLVLCVASVQLALDRWPVATWFDLRCTQFGTLLAQIGHQKSRKHFSKISKLKYFKILISGAIYVFSVMGHLNLTVTSPDHGPQLSKLCDIAALLHFLCVKLKFFLSSAHCFYSSKGNYFCLWLFGGHNILIKWHLTVLINTFSY